MIPAKYPAQPSYDWHLHVDNLSGLSTGINLLYSHDSSTII